MGLGVAAAMGLDGLQPGHCHRCVRIDVCAVTELPEDIVAPTFDRGTC